MPRLPQQFMPTRLRRQKQRRVKPGLLYSEIEKRNQRSKENWQRKAASFLRGDVPFVFSESDFEKCRRKGTSPFMENLPKMKLGEAKDSKSAEKHLISREIRCFMTRAAEKDTAQKY